MRTAKYFTSVIIMVYSFIFSLSINAQSNQNYIKIKTLHKNLNFENASTNKWIEIERDYLENVLKKNEYILQRDVLTHYMTEDNTEVLFISIYKNWEDIEKAEKRNKELEDLYWNDKKKKEVHFNYLDNYFDNNQSDEIYITSPGKKVNASLTGKSIYYHMRVNHLSFPKDGAENEFIKLNNEFLEKSVYNNQYIKSYHPFVQFLGADKRKYVELTAVESLSDLENAFKEIDEFLYEPKNEDAASHTIFIANYFKYFTGFHADYIYMSVPELKK